MELECGRLVWTGLYWLEIVIRVNISKYRGGAFVAPWHSYWLASTVHIGRASSLTRRRSIRVQLGRSRLRLRTGALPGERAEAFHLCVNCRELLIMGGEQESVDVD